MKKILAVALLSLSIAYLTGCTSVVDNSNSSQPSQQSLQLSQDDEKSDDEKSDDEKSGDEKSKDEKSNDEKSNDEKSNDEKSDDEKSDDEKSNDEKSDDENSDDENSDDEKSSDENSDSENSDEEISDSENSDEESSEIDPMEEKNIFNFRIKINDVIYQLPFDYAELEENGYFITRDGELEPENYSRSIEWKNEEGHVISTQLWNASNKKKSYEECKIGSMEIKLGEEFEVVLPGNFAFDTEITPEKIKEQYGEPESEHVYNDYVTLRYKVDLSKTVEFFIYTNENYIKFSSVTIKNFS